MKNFKKVTGIIGILFIVVITLPLIVACSRREEKTENDTTIQQDIGNIGSLDESTDEPTIDPRLSVSDELPETDFNGEIFTIIYPTWSMYNDYYFAEEEIGDKLNDAVYKRQKDIEERFNVVIDPVTKGYIDTVPNTVSKSVRAGTDDYQLALTHCISGVTQLTTTGLAYDWNNVDYVDFEKPWWNQRMNKEMSVEGILLTAVSDFIIFDPNVIYFNKKISQEIDAGDIYSIVKEGKWTWEIMTEMARAALKDINGDGTFTDEDQYGLVTHTGWMMDSVLQSCDLFTTRRDESGMPVCNLNNEKYANIINLAYDLVWNGNQTYLGSWDPNNPDTTFESQVPMGSGRTLFHIDPLSAGKRYRTYDVDFGILPFPKYDENQKEYLSLSWNGFMILPRTVNPDLAGIIVEALSAESYKYVVPAYYDVLLTSKVARDEESSEMIDIIYKGACYDFGLNYGNWGIGFTVSNLLSSKNTNVASFIEKNETSYNSQLKSVYNQIIKHYIEN